MKQMLINRIYSPIAALLIIIAALAASSATWFMFYQPHEPVCLRKTN